MTEAEQATQATEAQPPKGVDINFVREFMVRRQGKWVVLYAGLLSLAHERGLVSLSAEIVQYPTAENDQTCICLARATLDRDGKVQTFADIGDANPGSVAKPMIKHIIRMASTRAKSRALRDAVNIGVTALEELADADEDTISQLQAQAGEQPRSQPQPPRQSASGGPQPQRQAPAQPQRPAQQPSNAKPAANGTAQNATTIRLKINGHEFVVPDTFADLATEDLDTYAIDALELWGAASLDTLRGAWEDIVRRRAMMPEISFAQLTKIKDQAKKRLSQPAPAGKGQGNGKAV